MKSNSEIAFLSFSILLAAIYHGISRNIDNFTIKVYYYTTGNIQDMKLNKVVTAIKHKHGDYSKLYWEKSTVEFIALMLLTTGTYICCRFNSISYETVQSKSNIIDFIACVIRYSLTANKISAINLIIFFLEFKFTTNSKNLNNFVRLKKLCK